MCSKQVILSDFTQTLQLRDFTSFTPNELTELFKVFPKDWFNKHPITSSLDLSMYNLDSDDLTILATLYNNPLHIKEYIEKSIERFSDLRKFKNLFNTVNLNYNVDNIQYKLLKEKRILILINPNGTLLYKAEERLEVEKPCCLVLKHKYFYSRPNYNIFLKTILEHPRSVVALCSSMNKYNIEQVRKFLEKVFDREYTLKNSSNEYATTRNLLKIWNDKEFKGEFTPENTLLIETKAEKIKTYKTNVLFVNAYTLEDDNTLVRIGEYVKKLLDTADDIRTHLLEY